jgi:voltage-gated potassium channel Kch
LEKGHEVIHIANLMDNLPDEKISVINAIEAVFLNIDVASASMVYILNEMDEQNLEMVIALMAVHPKAPVCTALFNEQIRPHLELANPHLHILNPARIAAPVFVDALELPISRNEDFTAQMVKPAKVGKKKNDDLLLKTMVLSFFAIIVLATTYFHYFEQLSWINALYFVVVTVATVGYGDINLLASGTQSKLVCILLILSSTVSIWLIFSLTIDRIIKTRVQLALGRKRYHFRNHVILCGLGRLGYFIAEELCHRGEKVVLIELDENGHNTGYFRNKGLDVYTGNARIPRVLLDAGAAHCRALISVINDDYANLEVGLNARSIQPNLRLILRIFDENMAAVIKDKFDIHLTQSMSYIVASKCASLLDGDNAATVFFEDRNPDTAPAIK